VETDVSKVLSLRFLWPVKLPSAILKIMEDTCNRIFTAHDSLRREGSSMRQIAEGPIVQTATRIVCSPEVLLDEGRSGVWKQERLSPTPSGIETRIPRKVVAEVRVDALKGLEIVSAVEPYRIPHRLPEPAVLHPPKLAFHVGEEFLCSAALMETDACLQTFSAFIQ
jgi:hypothetical protein